MVIQYILLVIIILYLIIRFYIYKKYGFWYYQPVFHYYDLHYWFFKNKIINTNLPICNKFCNFINIKTYNLLEVDDINIKKYINFINKYYYNTKNAKYSPIIKNFKSYFESNNKKSFISIYEDNQILGLMTSRNLNININKTVFQIYYVDNLCIHNLYRKKGIAPEIIQTHEYQQAHKNNSAQVSLFKREGKLTGIIPLTTYYTKQYEINVENIKEINNINLIRITENNLSLLLDYIYRNKYKFEGIIIPDVCCLNNLIKKEVYIIYCRIYNKNITSAYFFKDSEMIYYDNNNNNNNKILDLFASITNDDYNTFTNMLNVIIKKESKIYNYINIEYISDNIIFEKYFLNSKVKLISPTAYFLYNYIQKPILANKILIII